MLEYSKGLDTIIKNVPYIYLINQVLNSPSIWPLFYIGDIQSGLFILVSLINKGAIKISDL